MDESMPVAAAGYECSAAETVVAGKPMVEDVFPWGVAWVEVLDYPLGLEGLNVGGEVHDSSSALFLWQPAGFFEDVSVGLVWGA